MSAADRNERERLRLREKRSNPQYRERERLRQRARLRARRDAAPDQAPPPERAVCITLPVVDAERLVSTLLAGLTGAAA
jgi:hypothetical protein